MPFEIKIKGMDKFSKTAASLRRSKKNFREKLYKTADLLGLDTLRVIRERHMTGPRPEKIGVGTGHLRRETRHAVLTAADRVSIRFGNPLAYSAIHEYGGDVQPKVTDKMRKWAWMKFYKTKDPIFRGLALTKKNILKIHIPARPYLAPGVREMLPTMREKVGALLKQVSMEGLSGGE